MDDKHPVIPSPRRGRSGDDYRFPAQALGTPYRSENDDTFRETLRSRQRVRVYREYNDPVYRREITLAQSAAPPGLGVHYELESDGETEVSTGPTDTASDRASSASVTARHGSVDRLSRPVTYSRHDQHRVSELRAVRAQRERGGVSMADLRRMAINTVYDFDRANIHPLVDKHDFVMAAIASFPKGEEAWWTEVGMIIERRLTRFHQKGDFADLFGLETTLRFGITFTTDHEAPYQIKHSASNTHQLSVLTSCEAFKAYSCYQNHLYRQLAPQGFARSAAKVAELVTRGIAFPAFESSVFTTCEISFCDLPSITRRNEDAAYDTMELISVFGDYDHTKRGQLIFWDEGCMLEVVPGATIAIAGGSLRYSFVDVALHETRMIFRQFCDARVLRWVEKDGRSDAEWEDFLGPKKLGEWQENRDASGAAGLKSFSKLRDIEVVL
ncbi:hypothetical protein B0H15DRAFT_801071 [Mycena belliarum]|uniref:Uncharacterized protein n=1 Tax=Mycena belliarum TaxID=1033014 RepID=A0AAD6U2H3_9AGAR|nr:hypothetical protein B0H15DRAFT_801071 [Mycena belliae]